MNAKEYGIPQNRERVYCVIIRKDLDNGLFEFPSPIPLQHSLNDLLENEVDEKYYLSDDKVSQMLIPTPPYPIDKKSGARLSKKGSMLDSYCDTASTLLARDYKGFGNQQTTGVVEKE